MEAPIFLAKIIGPLFIVVAISISLNHSYYKKMIKQAGDNPFLLYLSGFLAFIMGMLIILNYNVWNFNGFILITILGWISIIKGISLLIFPHTTIKNVNKFKITKGLIGFLSILWLLIGFCISYMGYINI